MKIEKDKYKVVFSDIDGTIINEACVVTPKTKAAIDYVQAKNIPVILVSARMPASLKHIYDMVGYPNPIISFSGALVRSADGEILFESTIPGKTCDALYKMVRESGLNIVCNTFVNDDWESEDVDNYWIQYEKEHIKITPHGNFRKDGLPDAHKFQCVGEADQVAAVEKLIAEHFPQLKAGTSIPQFLEIQNGDASKEKALRVLEEYYHVTPNEVVAAGDGPVDLEMICHAGLGVAMGNAPDDIKAAADYVTGSNEEDGLADVLYML